MKLTSPKEKNDYNDWNVPKIFDKFENLLKKEQGDQEVFQLILTTELPRSICEIVQEEYTKVGWIAECRTSSENGERPGLTRLKLTRPKQ
jgi:hypothetical protein